MDCTTAREGLWPPERPRLAGEDVIEARRHVESCPECRAYFAQDRMLLDSYDRMRSDRAPREVRERVFNELAQERAGRSHLRPGRAGWIAAAGWSAAAVTALAVGIMTLPDRSAGPADQGGTMFVEDYLRRAVGEDHIETSDPEEVTRFLVRELGRSLTPIQAEGLVLAGAEICLLEGRRGAMILYKQDGRVISHYIVPADGARPREPQPARPLAGVDGEGGPSVVTWANASTEQALVGAISPDQLLALARSRSN